MGRGTSQGVHHDTRGVVYFKGYRWWAERGLIHMENKDTGEYKTFSVKTCLERLRGLNDMVGNSKQNDGFHMPDEVNEHQRFVDAMLPICQMAREQGMPTDKSMKNSIKRAQKTVVMPGGNAVF
jgi:hypothetical protein